MSVRERKSLYLKALAVSLSLIILISMFVTTSTLSANAAVPEWQPGVNYAIGDLVTYQNKIYQCTSGHRSVDGWYPPVVPALWKESSVVITPDPTPDPTPVKTTQTPTSTVPSESTFVVSGYVSADVDSTATDIKAGFKVKLANIEVITDNNGYFEIKSSKTDSTGSTTLTITKTNYLTRTISNIQYNINSTIGSSNKPALVWAGDMLMDGIQDKVINMADIMELAKSFNTTSSDTKYVADSDLNKDNAINMADIMAVIKHFNKSSTDYPNDIDIITVTLKPTTTSIVSNTPTSTSTPTPSIIPSNPNKSNRVVSGYWETWDGIQVHPPVGHINITEVPMGYNVINVAFPILLSDGTCVLEDGSAPTEDVPEPAEIAQVKASGRKVLISIGGAAAGMDLSQRTVADKFSNTCIQVIEKYGFDGIDIDIESGLVAGPSWDRLSPSQENLIYIINKITDHFGPNFMLTMAPETAYVTGGTIAYGGPWGGYLPVINAVKDKLTWLQMQYYNGSMYGKDGTGYQAGTVEGIVKQTEALIDGFKIAGTNVTFSLPANKVVVGLPSSPGAGGGYAPPSTVQSAMSTLLAKYPNLRGLMTWSINWDASKGYEFVNNHRPFLDKYGNVQ